MLYVCFREFTISFFYYVIYGAEMIGSFDNIINIYGLICYAYGIGLKYVACLITGQSATLNMI